ncbi:P-loop containing nucleoside triphosphate hydrolase protein [Russula brevipes]|nr:P-loop containing nucleoside triphosphate hydrolase protein [Russula brevipes]
MGCFRHGLASATNHLKALRPSYVRFASSQLKQTSSQLKDPLRFSGLGLSRAVCLGLESAFPDITRATDAQAAFISAIIQGKDVMIKGDTGSGKSFGLVLALLSKCWNPLPDGRRPLPASLLLVPHRDLAYQFMHWIERIATATTGGPRRSIPAQVIVRGQDELSSQLSRLRENPPGILVGTPQAILDVLQEDEHAMNLSRLGTVVVDEVDYLIDFVPAGTSKDRKQKLAAKMRRHPSAGKCLLDQIYARRVAPEGSSAVGGSPQLVVCSATFQTGLRQQLYQNGWFRKGIDSVVKVRSEMPAGTTRKSEQDATVEGVQHGALVFADDGSVRDVDGAVEPKSLSEDDVMTRDGEACHQEEVTWTNFQGDDVLEMSAHAVEEHSGTPSAFHPVPMEGIASVFATEVPKVALLVLPASAPVQRAVYDLRVLGVNAVGLNLLRETTSGEENPNPTLMVSTTVSIRGIDLPDLSHVFIWGVVDANSYLHASGRVGRFGRPGRVVSVLDDDEQGGQSGRYRRLLKSIGIVPTKFCPG